MREISKWELLGLPAAVVFGAMHRLGLFDRVGITDEQLPDLMIVVFFVLAGVRAGMAARKARPADGPAHP